MAHTITTLTVGQMAANCYLFDHYIIDPGDDAEYISEMLTRLHIKPVAIIATHGHFDHLMAARALQLAYGIPCYLAAQDTFLARRLKNSARQYLGISTDPPPIVTELTGTHIGPFDIVATPGHTPGSVCLYAKDPGMLITGDTIFAGGAVGRSDWQYSDVYALRDSLSRILSFPQETLLYPGHGEASTVLKERAYHSDLVY